MTTTRWPLVRLEEVVAEALPGFAVGRRDPHGVVQLRMNNVDTQGHLNWSDYVRVPATSGMISKYRLLSGDVVFNNTNSTALVGKSARFAGYAEPVVYSNHFTRLRPVPDRLDSAYLAAWLLRLWQQHTFEDLCNRWIGQSAVNREKLLALEIPLPSVSVQRRIVAKLDEQMSALDRAEKALAEQQAAALAFKRATLQTALDQAIHPEWECATLMDLCTFANGLWTGKKPPFQQASVIRNTNFTRDCTLDFSDIAHLDVEERQLRSRRLRTGDIILERSGGGPKQPVGRVALFELNDEFYSFSNFTSVIRVNERNGVLPRFLWYYLFHLYSSGVTEALQNHTSGIRNLDFSSYVMLSIPVPTLDEQRRVVEQLDWSIEQANNLLSYVAEQALTLASLRTSLLNAAFSGEISHD